MAHHGDYRDSTLGQHCVVIRSLNVVVAVTRATSQSSTVLDAIRECLAPTMDHAESNQDDENLAERLQKLSLLPMPGWPRRGGRSWPHSTPPPKTRRYWRERLRSSARWTAGGSSDSGRPSTLRSAMADRGSRIADGGWRIADGAKVRRSAALWSRPTPGGATLLWPARTLPTPRTWPGSWSPTTRA